MDLTKPLYQHYKDKRLSVCIIVAAHTTVIGAARCAPRDAFSKKLGRDISLGRAKSDHGIVEGRYFVRTEEVLDSQDPTKIDWDAVYAIVEDEAVVDGWKLWETESDLRFGQGTLKAPASVGTGV
jgi:hypothetical protein